MISKEQTEAIEKFAQAVEGSLLPYPTADKIIAEVLKNGEKSREAVMRMLLEFAGECISSRDGGLAQLRADLSALNK